MDQEWLNVRKRCRQPLFAAALLSFWARQAGVKLFAKVAPHTWRYPSNVKAAFHQMASDLAFGQRAAAPMPSGAFSGRFESYELDLAVGSLACHGLPDWSHSFDDPEQLVSLHRWNWLLTRLTVDPFPGIRDWGLALMLDWSRAMGAPKSGFPWETYTTGERICNAILFLACSDGGPPGLPVVPGELRKTLLDMACHVSARLEYGRPGFAWNHVLNNARALYFAGQALAVPSCSRLALAILRHDLPAIVNSEGFLREGSVHYHFLVTRWLLEVIWLARLTGDRECLSLLEPVAASMVQRSWTFLIFDKDRGEWTIPLIGDVSPDFSWSWLAGLPWSGLAQSLYGPPHLPEAPRQAGWGRLFGQERSGEGGERAAESAEPRIEAFPLNGWYRLDLDRLTLFWHVEPAGAPSFVSHGHCDTGSFALYWDGSAILTDPGRFNYSEDDALGMYGVSARAHNNVLLDGLEPFVYKNPNRLPPFYRCGQVQVQWKTEDPGLSLWIEHAGFHRLAGDAVSFRRTFTVRPDKLIIEDQLDGRSWHTVETFFQWSPGVQVTKNGEGGGRFAVRSRNGDFAGAFWSEPGGASAEEDSRWRHVRGEASPLSGGWYFPGYGARTESSTLIHESRTRLPCVRRFVLKWAAPSR